MQLQLLELSNKPTPIITNEVCQLLQIKTVFEYMATITNRITNNYIVLRSDSTNAGANSDVGNKQEYKAKQYN